MDGFIFLRRSCHCWKEQSESCRAISQASFGQLLLTKPQRFLDKISLSFVQFLLVL